MTFRITDPEQLKHLSPGVRKQLEQYMPSGEISSPSNEAAKINTAPARGRRERPEQEAGRLLIQWIDALVIEWPELGRIRVGEYFAHNANGGARTAIEGAILAGQGVRRGWPDYTLYLARDRWHGAVLELKAEDGSKPDDEQLEILQRLERAGYKPIIAWGFEQARAELERYLQRSAPSGSSEQ